MNNKKSELNIFNFDDYKKYLRTYIDQSSARGIIKDLSVAANVHRPYLSKVLNSHIHLLPDQLYGICRFLKLTEGESEFLLLLLEKERSDKIHYKKFIENKIKALIKTEEDKIKAYGRENHLSMTSEETWIYYSHWLYPLIHISTSIPAFQKIEVLSEIFGQKKEKILLILTQLLKMGFVRKEKDQWIWNQGSGHTSQDDPRTLWLYRHLRDFCHHVYQAEPKQGLHFSVIQSISKDDFKSLQQSLMKWIDDFNRIARPSKPEIPVVLCFDFFQIGPEVE